MKDLYIENYRKSKKEIKDYTRRQKELPHSGKRNISSLNGLIIKTKLQLQCTPHQNTNGILHRLEKTINKIHVEKEPKQS